MPFTKEELEEMRRADEEIEREIAEERKRQNCGKPTRAQRKQWSRNYYKKHRERLLAYQHEYYKANRDKVLERQRAYYQAHKT